MRFPLAGPVRVLLTAAAGTGLVLGAARAPVSWAMPGPATAPGAGPGELTGIAGSRLVRAATLVCPGPELQGVRGVADIPAPGAAFAAAAPPAAIPGVALPSGPGRLTLGYLLPKAVSKAAVSKAPVSKAAVSKAPVSEATMSATTTRPVVVVGRYRDPFSLVATGSAALAPAIAAGQEWLLAGKTARGLGSAPCGEASADAWLLAGGGQAGRQERLVLSNPGGNPVSVDLTLYGAKGVVDSPNGYGVVVPAAGRTVVLLDSISATEPAPAVHVVVQGGVVRAVLNDYWLDGVLPAGSDDSVPAAAPARQQVVPGVAIDGAGALRVVVPGTHDAVVQARYLTPAGRAPLPKGGVKRVRAGSTADFDLGGQPRGAYAVQVTSDVPVTAAATVARRANARSVGDFAWAPATTAITSTAGTPLVVGTGPAALQRRLSLAASGGGLSAEVVTVSAKGVAATREVRIGGDSSTSIDVSGAASVWVRRSSGAGQLHAAVISTAPRPDGPLVSVLPLVDAPLMERATPLVQLRE